MGNCVYLLYTLKIKFKLTETKIDKEKYPLY